MPFADTEHNRVALFFCTTRYAKLGPVALQSILRCTQETSDLQGGIVFSEALRATLRPMAHGEARRETITE